MPSTSKSDLGKKSINKVKINHESIFCRFWEISNFLIKADFVGTDQFSTEVVGCQMELKHGYE